jgi:hypothetical protein
MVVGPTKVFLFHDLTLLCVALLMSLEARIVRAGEAVFSETCSTGLSPEKEYSSNCLRISFIGRMSF